MEKNLQRSEILDGCARNERKYQEILYKAYYPFFIEVVQESIKDRSQAIDRLNLGFLQIFKTIGSYDYQTPFEEWILDRFKEAIK